MQEAVAPNTARPLNRQPKRTAPTPSQFIIPSSLLFPNSIPPPSQQTFA